MAILQLGRFALLTRLLGLRAPCHCVKKAKRGDCKRTPKNARSVAMFPLRWLAARFRGTVLLQPVHQKHSLRAATSDRVSDNTMAVVRIELKAL